MACHASTSCVDPEGAHSAMLYAFDLTEHDGQDLRDLPFLDRKAALEQLLRGTDTHILFNEHVAEDGPMAFAHACRPRASFQSGWMAPIDPVRAQSGSRFAIRPASLCSGTAVRGGTGEYYRGISALMSGL